MDFQKYNIKEKTKKKRKKQSHKNDFKKYIYEVCFKNRVFFWKVIVGYKNEKGVIEDLKIKKLNLKSDNSKKYI